MSFKISFNDLERILIAAFNQDNFTAAVVADYLDELDIELDLSRYLWNTLLFNVQVFETKTEALQWIEENLDCEVEECIIYECANGFQGVYLEHP